MKVLRGKGDIVPEQSRRTELSTEDCIIMDASDSKQCKLRLVLVGKTGLGKSATGNTILGRKVFESNLSSSSLTEKCEKGINYDKQIAVIDTPGLFDTKFTQEEIVERIKECISFSSPGPHAFLICIQLGRFTKEEKETVQLIQMIFGKEAADYTMVLFTYGDLLEEKSIESFIEENEDLSELIKKCQNRYHVFNNKSKNVEQTNAFMKKIKEMVQMNGGGYYTNDMFRIAEEAIEKEKERLLKESEEQRKKELEEIAAKYAEDQEHFKKEETELIERYTTVARMKAETSNEFMKTYAAIGAAVGAALGPVGSAVGAALGVALGALIGAIERDKCVIQ